MATAFKLDSFRDFPIAAPGAAPTNVRVAFIAGPAVQATAKALDTLPEAVRESTLDELMLGSMVEMLLGAARETLSPRMYTAFLRWGETASHLCTFYHTDEEG